MAELKEISVASFGEKPLFLLPYLWARNPNRANWTPYLSYLVTHNKDDPDRITRQCVKHIKKGFNVVTSFDNFIEAGGVKVLSLAELNFVFAMFLKIASHEGMVVYKNDVRYIIQNTQLVPFPVGRGARGIEVQGAVDMVQRGIIKTMTTPINWIREKMY